MSRIPNVPWVWDGLSFVTKKRPRGGGGLDYWNVEPSGDFDADGAAGRRLGEEYLDYLGRYPTVHNATLLQQIVLSMAERIAKRGRSNVEVGFLQAVNEYAMHHAHVRFLTAAEDPDPDARRLH